MEELDRIVPNMFGWTCCNKYSTDQPVPLYYNYTKEISTFVNVEQAGDNNLYFYINKVPMISYDYLSSEDRILEVLTQLQLVRSFIEYKLETIEDGFGLDIKLFNTYGPAKLIIDFSFGMFWQIIGIQTLYIILSSVILLVLYKIGTKRLNVNGG